MEVHDFCPRLSTENRAYYLPADIIPVNYIRLKHFAPVLLMCFLSGKQYHLHSATWLIPSTCHFIISDEMYRYKMILLVMLHMPYSLI